MKYVIGVDFGTLSARAIVAGLEDGHITGEGVSAYAKGVMTTALPDGTPLLGGDWALADPMDYLDSLRASIKGALDCAAVQKEDILSIAIASTACTLLPVTKDLTPLCALPGFASRPHAFAMLWKHHRAKAFARHMTDVAREMEIPVLNDYGGSISSEWAIPKAMEIMTQDPECYMAADRFMQLSDWLTARLVGDPDVQNASILAYKGMWRHHGGFPDDTYLAATGASVPEIIHQKLRGRRIPAGGPAGRLTASAAEALGLCPGTAVGMAHTDAHAAALGAGACKDGDYVYILGTSSCAHFLSRKKVVVPGVTGAIEDGLIPGLTCYSAGQACVGDMLDWFIQHTVPSQVREEAKRQGRNIHSLLEEQAAAQRPGECAVMALDWWNGNRSVLGNAALSGLLAGLTMDTRPADIYRALLDSIAFGHREIWENFQQKGLRPRQIILCGGIARKNRLLSQIIADVLNCPVSISEETQSTARGAAICAAAALEKEPGYDSLAKAVRRMKGGIAYTLRPVAGHVSDYERLYGIYHRIHDFFGRENPGLMEELRNGFSART